MRLPFNEELYYDVKRLQREIEIEQQSDEKLKEMNISLN